MHEHDGTNQQEHHDSGQSGYAIYEELLHSQKITTQDVLDHLTGPVVSIIVHVILITLLATLLTGTSMQSKSEISVEVTEVDIKELQKPPEPPQPPEEMVEEEIEIKVETPTVNNAPVDGPVAETVGVADAPTDVKMPDLLSVKPNSSALKMPGLMAARGGAGRKAALKKYNTSGSDTERSVNKGLKWLVDHQNEDGSWGTGQQGAMTGLAVLCFLAHGETPSSPEYGQTVLRGIKRLIGFTDTIAGDPGLINSAGNGYGHAIVAYALSEAYALTRIPQVENAMNKIITTIVKGQNSLGSYNYGFNNKPSEEAGGGPRSDLSVAGWNYQALKAAFAAGAKVDGLEAAIEKGIKAIQEVHGAKAGFTYGVAGSAAAGPITMSSVGTLCLQLFGAGKLSAAQKGLALIESIKIKGAEGTELTMDWKNITDGLGTPLYGWYYFTQAVFQGHSGSGPEWKKWNASFTKTLTKEQETDGHWETPSVKYADKKLDPKTGKMVYSGLETISATPGGDNMDMKVYSTALCILMLEVYYRYLPTYKVEGGHADTGESQKKDDDLGIKIE
ncbi:MAG: hypothetical protein A2X49_15190 [Lentisphaerae bacterium GWF2_52_8]|nr:MAG: hypothetical protein A2X49_15190 [Lentisphaerae bacterium GWF2_52_8]